MKKLLFLLYFIPIISFGQTTQNITPFFGADFPYHNPTDSIYISWAYKPDGMSSLYTGWYLRNHFLQKNDSARYVTSYYLTHANIPFNGTPNFLNGLALASDAIPKISYHSITGAGSIGRVIDLETDIYSAIAFSQNGFSSNGFFLSNSSLTKLSTGLYVSDNFLGTTMSMPSVNAALYFDSSNKGIRLPNLTFATRTGISPTPYNGDLGLMVYQADGAGLGEGIYVLNSSSAWTKLAVTSDITSALTGVLNLSGPSQTVAQTPTFNNGINVPSVNTSTFLQKNSSPFMYTYSDGVRQGEDLYIGNGSGNTTHTGHTTTPFEQDNIAIGDSTLTNLINGYAITAVGWNAGHSYKTTYSNTLLGYRADELDTAGYGNSAMGTYVLGHNLNSAQMSMVGWHAGLWHTTGNYWASVGDSFMVNNIDGVGNTGMGSNGVGANNIHGSYNVFLGYRAAPNETGSYKLYIESNTAYPNNPLIGGDFSARTLQFNGTVSSVLNVSGVATFNNLLQNTGNFVSSGGLGRAIYNGPVITPTANGDVLVGADFGAGMGIGTGFLTATLTTPGTGYNNGTYTNVPLINITGTGTGAVATVTVSGGAITSVTQTTGGVGYAVNNTFTFASGFDGGTATGFIGTVATLGYNNVAKYSARFNSNPIQVPAIASDPTYTGNASMWYNYTTGNFNIKANSTVYALNALPASVIASGTLGVARGGTGLGSYSAVGSLLYSASTSSTGQLADVATGSILTSGGVGTAPAYSSALPNGITATTQTAGDNSTKVATTAYVATTVAPAASNDLTGQTTAGTIMSTTSAATTGTYVVDGYLNVSAISADTIQVQCTYTDENNMAQTVSFSNISSVGNTDFHTTIRVKASTTITLKTNLSTGGGTITFDAGGYIKKAY